jgi:type IV pilus biogenesis protein CpaD/CtpE
MNMIERPEDLITGRPEGPADGNREALAVKTYEQGQIKPFKDINAPSQMILPPGTTGAQ